MTSYKYIHKFVLLVFAAAILSGCGSYYHYGLARDTSKVTIKQKDAFFITGDYEFKSILFTSNDGNLTISVQHPLHPIPEPNIFISQIEFSLNEQSSTSYQVQNVQFLHKTDNGNLISPFENGEFSQKELKQTSFHILKYNRYQLSPSLLEYIEITFTYNGDPYTLKFEETIKLVRRWSKLSVVANS